MKKNDIQFDEEDLQILQDFVTCSPEVIPGGLQESIKIKAKDPCCEEMSHSRDDRSDFECKGFRVENSRSRVEC